METNNRSRFPVLLTLCAVAALMAGCATDEERWETADFGDSVRHTIALQTEYPGSAGLGLDGQKAANVMKVYREDVAKPKATQQDAFRFRVTQ